MERETLRSSECGVKRPAHSAAESVIKALSIERDKGESTMNARFATAQQGGRSRLACWSRREFLEKTAAMALAGAAIPGALSAETQKKSPSRWTMRLSTSSIHFMTLPIEEACARIARLGFEAIDIWSAHAGCPHLDDVQKRLGADGLTRILEKNNLKLFSFSVYRGGYARYAELLGQVGGGVAVRGSTRFDKTQPLTRQMQKFLDSLQPEIELAEKYDSYLAIENHGHALLNTLDSLKAFVELNRSPRVGIALAPFHVQGLKASVVEAIRIAGPQLFFFYAWQRASTKSFDQLPGQGPTDFAPWIAALAEVGYRGYVNPFMHGEKKPDEMSAALTRAKTYLEQCYRRAVQGS